MRTIIGIDVGGSTTKIVGFGGEKHDVIISPIYVKASDPTASIYGAFGKFTSSNGIGLNDIDRIMITGVGSVCVENALYGIETHHLSEFECIGRGGLYVSGFDKAIIVSMGTGTAIVAADRSNTSNKYEYLGGTGVGGGTLSGLASRLIGISSVRHLIEVAKDGKLSNVDLSVGDMTKKNIGVNADMTAANFGKISDLAAKEDLALGLINMVCESVAMLGIFAARAKGTRDIVLTGNLSRMPQAKAIFAHLSEMFDMNFVIPDNSEFSTVIGAALAGRKFD